MAGKCASQLFVLVVLGDSLLAVYRLPVQWLEILEISTLHCVSVSLSLNYGLFAEPPERRAPVVRVAETRALEAVHIHGDTQVSARMVLTHFNKYRRDTRQQADFTASHILVALPHIPLAFIESVKIAFWLKHFCRHVIIRKGVHYWAAEYIRLCCVQRLQSARTKHFYRPTQASCFVVFCFMAGYVRTPNLDFRTQLTNKHFEQSHSGRAV